MSEQEVVDLGFKKVKMYEHDQYYTNRFKKVNIMVEFTYLGNDFKNGTLEDVDITIDEIIGMEVTFNELNVLDLILNK